MKTRLTAAGIAVVLALGTSALPTRAPAQSNEVPIRIKLSDEVYALGDRARVRIKTAKDGYIVVLRVTADGHVRVLYPLDPSDTTLVQGGREFELRGRGGRETFTVSEKKGAGLIFAARSDTPFNFRPFTEGSHWDLDALVPVDTTGDPEAAMLNLVDRMGDARYEYDALPYAVDANVYRRPAWVTVYDPWYRTPFIGGGRLFYTSWPWLYGPRYGFTAGVLVPIRAFSGWRR